MPHLTDDQKKELAKDIVKGELSKCQLKDKYHITYATLRTYYRDPIIKSEKKEIISEELAKTVIDTKAERKEMMERLKEQLVKVENDLKALQTYVDEDGKIIAPPVLFLQCLNATFKTINECLTGIDKANQVAETYIDNRSVTINQDVVGRVLWRYLSEKGLIEEATRYLMDNQE